MGGRRVRRCKGQPLDQCVGCACGGWCATRRQMREDPNGSISPRKCCHTPAAPPSASGGGTAQAVAQAGMPRRTPEGMLARVQESASVAATGSNISFRSGCCDCSLLVDLEADGGRWGRAKAWVDARSGRARERAGSPRPSSHRAMLHTGVGSPTREPLFGAHCRNHIGRCSRGMVQAGFGIACASMRPVERPVL